MPGRVRRASLKYGQAQEQLAAERAGRPLVELGERMRSGPTRTSWLIEVHIERESDIRLTFPYPTRFPCQAGSLVRVDTTWTRSI